MKVLHLFANCKWTGPAEPALNLCVGLRALGVEADFACAPDAGKSHNKVVSSARERGIEPVLDFHLKKHKHPWYNFQDKGRLKRFLAAHPYDLIHCHLDNDHRIAAPAARALGIPLIRTSYEGVGFRESGDHHYLMAHTDFLIEASERAAHHDHAVFGMPNERMAVVPGAVDTDRFDPSRTLPDGRARLGIPSDALVAGIVARMQTHRHYEDLFQAFKKLRESVPHAHLIVVGRGTKQEQVGFAPVRDLGLEGTVHFPGYLDGDDFVGMLKAMDFGLFLTPGSDGTCRAARELLAMGRPLIVTTRGMLPEIVADGIDGLVCDGSIPGLTKALHTLAQDPDKRHQMAQAARTHALNHYALPVQARAVKAIYERVLAG